MAKVRAIRRKWLSRPLQLALSWGILRRGDSYHDVGEGYGDDVRHLKKRRIRATGHDPHFSPGKKAQPADVIGLVYVLNTIADPRERSMLLRSSWKRARRALLVASRTDEQDGTPHRDGVLTSAGTFQRNWDAEQLRRYVGRILGRDVEELAPGVVVVKKTSPAGSKKDHNGAPVRPNKTRKISQRNRIYYRDSRRKAGLIPSSFFLDKSKRRYPYRAPSGRIDCNMLSAAIKRARLNGDATVLKKAKVLWDRVCRPLAKGRSQ